MRLALLAAVCLLVSTPTAAAPAGVTPTTNDAPFADAGLDRTVRAGETVLLDGGGSFDPDGRLVRHEWRIETPGGGSLDPAEPTARTTRFRPTGLGRYAVTLTVEDDEGATRTDTLFVDVRAGAPDTAERAAAPNEPPTGHIRGPSSVTRGESAAFRADVSDPDGEVVSYGWSTGATGRTATEAFDPDGTEVPLSVTVTDDDGATVRLNRTIDVRTPEPGAVSPDLDPDARVEGPDRVAVGEEATYVLRGDDPDGELAGYEWDHPGSATGRTLTHTFAEPGSYPVRGTVVDDTGASDSATTTVEVYEEGEPAASISGPDTAPAGSVRTYRVEAFDPDGGPVTVSWSPERSGGSTSQFENRVRMPDATGSPVTVSATVTDDEGERVTVSESVEVTSGGSADGGSDPVVSDAAVWRVTDDSHQTSPSDTREIGSYVFWVGVEGGVDGPLTATWEFNDGTVKTESLVRVDGTARSSVRHTFVSDNGSERRAVADVAVTDAVGNSATERLVTTVDTAVLDDDVAFGARTDDREVVDGTLTVPAGTSVSFSSSAVQSFRVEYGDGTVEEFERTPSVTRFTHTYDTVGTHTVQLSTAQGPTGLSTRRITVRVVPPVGTETSGVSPRPE